MSLEPDAVTGPAFPKTTVDTETEPRLSTVNTKTGSKQRVRNALSQLLSPCPGHRSANCSLSSSSTSLALQNRSGALRRNLHYGTLRLKRVRL